MSTQKRPIFLSKEKSSSNFWKSRSSSYTSSNYWLKDSLFDKKESIFQKEESINDNGKYDYYQLAQYQRAISNFVRIMTGRSDIVVEYVAGNKNYTDGKTVTISPNIKEKEFDVAVGLALHESSHIVYTDFQKWNAYISNARNGGPAVATIKKLLLNLVEDLFIDAMTYKGAPGYRGYYAALYQKYFGDKRIIDGMWSSDYAEPTWDNYLFHLVNIRNPNRNLNALPGLREMFDAINLQNIMRLTDMDNRIELASLLYDEIKKRVKDEETQSNAAGSENDDNDDEDQMYDALNKSLENYDDIEGNEVPVGIKFDGEGGEGKPLDMDKLSPKAKESLQKIFEKQKELINGDIRKGKVSKDAQSKITAMATTDIQQRVVGSSYYDSNDYKFGNKGITLHVIRSLTESFVDTLGYEYGIYSKKSFDSSLKLWGNSSFKRKVNLVENGINRGRLLAKKLQLRNEERILKTSRLESGKIDKRLLHQIGIGNEDIFEKINITSYKPSYVHLSIDSSSSMAGRLFDSAVELAAMFATASKYIQNIHLQVSVRSATRTTPFLMYIFDSKKDSIQTIRSVFPRLKVVGTTPEGLAFEGIMKEIVNQSKNNESYFINICDGEPWFSSDKGFTYAGIQAREHSNKQMIAMEKAGIKFITYFIGGTYDFKNVKECYGKNAFLLSSPSEMNTIVKTMQSKLMEV